MHRTQVILKDGTELNGHTWEVRPYEGWFTFITYENEDRKIFMKDCESVTTFGERITKNNIGDQDMLAVWAERREEEHARRFKCDQTEKGMDRHGGEEYLGGRAGVSTAAGYLICSRCSPEPLDWMTAVIMMVRKVGWPMKKDGGEVHLDVIECPQCGAQILR